jgi:microsomal epoxide hydrolase
MPVQPFDVTIPDAVLEDLSTRLASTRVLPDEAGAAAEVDSVPLAAGDWDAAIRPAYLGALLEYWRAGFDWRSQEAALRRFSHYTASLGGTLVHFIHQRGLGDQPLPLILTHGFPDSFLRFVKLIPLLTDPAAHGGDPADAFDVVVPSLPGFGFSGPPDRHSDLFHVADRWHELMTDVLGYARYGAHGGDWGSTVTEHLARSHGDAVVGIHLTDVPFWHAFRKPSDPSPAEADYLAAIDGFQRSEGAYAMIQGTRPQTLAAALDDSPAGLAAWMVPFFQRWSDCGGEVERCFTRDELLTQLTLYWATGTIGTSFLPYHDIASAGAGRWMLEQIKHWIGSSKVPAGFAMFPRDLSHPPRAWAERFFRVERWAEMPRGGHFAAHEQPALLAEELRAFFRPLRRAAAPGQYPATEVSR